MSCKAANIQSVSRCKFAEVNIILCSNSNATNIYNNLFGLSKAFTKEVKSFFPKLIKEKDIGNLNVTRWWIINFINIWYHYRNPINFYRLTRYWITLFYDFLN